MKLTIAAVAIAFSGTALVSAPCSARAATQQEMKPAATAKAGWQEDGFAKAGLDAGGFKTGMAGEAPKGESWTAKLGTDEFAGKGDVAGAKFQTASADLSGKSGMNMSGKTGIDMDAGGGAWADNGDMGAKLASLDMGAKGQMGAKTELGMGGPEEVRISSAKQSIAHDSGEPAEVAAVAKDPAVMNAGKERYAGMGGPEEAVTEYPPCRPGRGDDRCIQLYEIKRGLARS